MHRFIFILFITITANSYGQNLIANSTFSDVNICTEFYKDCAPEAWFFVPSYIEMTPVENTNYYQIVSLGNIKYGTRGNIIYTKLLCPLKENKKYIFRIRAFVPENEFISLDVVLPHDEPTKKILPLLGAEAMFTITPENKIYTGFKWMAFTYTYTATGTERFLAIGNFTHQPLNKDLYKSNGVGGQVLCYVDDISLLAQDSSDVACIEMNAVVKQLYDQNDRHPAGLIDAIKLDTSLFIKPKKDTEEVPVIEIPKTDTLILPDILFKTNSSELNTKFIELLDSLSAKVAINVIDSISVTGHTDNKGTYKLNNALSINRAKTIKTYLLKKNKNLLIIIFGKGQTMPRATNTTVAGRQLNRRVEIIIHYK